MVASINSRFMSKLANHRLISSLVISLVTVFTVSQITTAPASAAITNVPYGSDPLQVMNILPSASANSPLVVLVHGGGWSTGSKNTLSTESNQLRDAGFSVFNINYRLTTSTTSAFPMEINDVKLATTWAINHAAQYNANPANVILLGGSAGGHLVAIASEQLNDATPNQIKKVITLSAPTDFTTLVPRADAGTLKVSFAENIYQALGCQKGTCVVSEERAWSPVYHTSSNCAKWLMFQSQNEFIPRDQFTGLSSALRQSGCTVTTNLIPGTAHSYDYWSTVSSAIISFIRP